MEQIKLKVFDVRPKKVAKGHFVIEYKTGRWTDWTVYPKKFKSATVATDWISTHVIYNVDNAMR